MKTEEEINMGVTLTEEAKLSLFEYMVRTAIVTKWGGGN